MTVDQAERSARAALMRAAEPGWPPLAAALGRTAATDLVAALRGGGDVQVADVTGRRRRLDATAGLARRLAAVDGAAELARGASVGARLVCPGDPEWPPQLGDLDEVEHEGHGGPPIGLWVRGPTDLRELARASVAVVGSRAASDYGCSVAGELAADLAEPGRLVVSGAAYGIDAAAHRGALAVGGCTLAVLACGVDVPYPRGHASLLERILDAGAIASECPPGAHPQRSRFLSRNRLIAALTSGTVVVEAALRSGALSTARWAGELRRHVFGVPGPVTSALSAGVHHLIREQQLTLVTCAAEVAQVVAPLGMVEPVLQLGLDRPWDGLPAAAAAVLEAVPARGGVEVDTLLLRTGLRLGECLRAVAALANRGLVEPDGDRWRLGPAIRRRGGP